MTSPIAANRIGHVVLSPSERPLCSLHRCRIFERFPWPSATLKHSQKLHSLNGQIGSAPKCAGIEPKPHYKKFRRFLLNALQDFIQSGGRNSSLSLSFSLQYVWFNFAELSLLYGKDGLRQKGRFLSFWENRNYEWYLSAMWLDGKLELFEEKWTWRFRECANSVCIFPTFPVSSSSDTSGELSL